MSPPVATSSGIKGRDKTVSHDNTKTSSFSSPSSSPQQRRRQYNKDNKTIDVIRIDGKYYDTQELAAFHPGGEIFVLMANGSDGTALYNSSHRHQFDHERYTAFLVPEEAVDTTSLPPVDEQKFELLFEIARAVRPQLTGGGYAPWWYYLKVPFILGGAFGIDAFCLFLSTRTLLLSFVQGVFFAWIGLNIQHDANHGAVSRNGKINRLLGLTQDYIGGSALGWLISHNVIHHVHCNSIGRDDDLDVVGVRTYDAVPWLIPHQLQHYYIWLLQGLFGFFHPLYNLYRLFLLGPNKYQKVLVQYWNTHRLLTLPFLLRWGACLWTLGFTDTLQNFALQHVVGGFYLAFFFFLSHNFEGVRKEGVDSMKDCFVRNQCETSSNVCGAKLAFFNGGLNYQIEHHLFPRIHHSFYPKIAPTVRKICEREGYKYAHFPTIWDNATSVYRHLRSLGKNPALACSQ